MTQKRRGRKRKRGRRKNPKEGLLMGRGLHKQTVDLINYIKKNILLKNQQKIIRRIFYALEASQIVESSDEAYQKTQYACKMARYHGLIHPEQFLVDKGRTSRSYIDKTYLASKIFKLLARSALSYNINFWDISDTYIEVWQEKEGMETEFLPLCNKYNVKLETGRGDQSITVIWYAMKRFDQLLTKKTKIVILYFGDFNPSGLHAPVAIQNTMTKLRNTWKHEFRSDFKNIEFQRIALNLEHVKKFNLPENPTKKKTYKDKKIAERFIRKYGDINVEMESLVERHPEEFHKLIETAIVKYVDPETKAKAKHRTEVARRRIGETIKEMMSLYFKDKWDTEYFPYSF